MTKRFKKRQHCLSWGIKDTVTWEQLNIDETINLLNNIYEENIKLKIENEQLKKDLLEVHEICAYYEGRIKELKGDVE